MVKTGMDLIDPKLLKRLQNWHKRLCKFPNISSDEVPRSFNSCFDQFVDETDARVMECEARELMNDWIDLHNRCTADAAAVNEQSSDHSSSLPVSLETESGYCSC